MSANGTPERVRMENLRRANAVRIARKEVKQQLRCRHLNIVAVLMDPPQCCERAQIGDVLRWAPMVGRAKSERILVAMRMSASVQLGRIPEPRRRALVNELVSRTPALQGEPA